MTIKNTKPDARDWDCEAYWLTQHWFRDYTDVSWLYFCEVCLGDALRRSIALEISRTIRKQQFPQAWRQDQETAATLARLNLEERKISRRTRGKPNKRQRIRQRARIRWAESGLASGNRRILVRDAPRLKDVAKALAVSHSASILYYGGQFPSLRLRQFLRARRAPNAMRDRASAFISNLSQALGSRGVKLDASALERIHEDTIAAMVRIHAIDRCLDSLRPELVLLHDDATPDGLEYVLMAKRYGIPSLSVQHGLDCERYFLDVAYADTKCVWGEERRHRIQRHGCAQNTTFQVTGNPAYDDIDRPVTLQSPGRHWLWVTRPHTEDKCVEPTRFVHEGKCIFEDLLTIVSHLPTVQLTVKPHPNDYSALYHYLAARSTIADRVQVIDDAPLDDLLTGNNVVICEDSTAALDAILAGKPLIHVHYAPSLPVLPLASYGAAFSAFSKIQLSDSLARIMDMTDFDRDTMKQGQQRFLADFAGPLDGDATYRLLETIHTIV